MLLLVNETKDKKRRILIYLTKAVLKRTSNAIFSMKKVKGAATDMRYFARNKLSTSLVHKF